MRLLGIWLWASLLFLMGDGASGRSRGRGRTKEVDARKLTKVFSWKQLQYEGSGLAGQNESVIDVPMGIEILGDRLFLGVPRRRLGVPSTLNYVELTDKNESPALRPYPSKEANDLAVEGSLVSTSRPKLDSCGRLWIVDTGFANLNGSSARVRAPKIVIIDLKSDTIIKTHELQNIRDYLNNDPTGMVSLTVDVPKGDCGNAFAYIPDLLNNGIVVYSLKADDSWRVKHNFFHLSPEEGDFELNGLQFQWDDGVFSIALGVPNPDGYRTVYFHAMASFSERSVPSSVLRDKKLAARTFHGDDFKTVGNRGPKSQTNIHVVDQESGVMFSTQPATSSLNCWNTKRKLEARSIGTVAQDKELLLYPSDMKLDDHGNVWVLSNKFPFFLYSTLDTNVTNFRVFRVSIQDAIKNTVCQ